MRTGIPEVLCFLAANSAIGDELTDKGVNELAIGMVTAARHKLREEKLQVVRNIGIKSEALTKTWKHPNLAKLEQTNQGFKRKSRICNDCIKEMGLKK